jgi:hypothetical protein
VDKPPIVRQHSAPLFVGDIPTFCPPAQSATCCMLWWRPPFSTAFFSHNFLANRRAERCSRQIPQIALVLTEVRRMPGPGNPSLAGGPADRGLTPPLGPHKTQGPRSSHKGERAGLRPLIIVSSQ